MRRNKGNKIILYDMDEVITAKIENFKDSPAVLTLIEHIPGEWKMLSSSLGYEKDNANRLKYEIVLPARGKDGPAVVNLKMHYQRLNIR